MEKNYIKPRVVRRENGGFMAISPKGVSIQIGVVGETEQEAFDSFEAAYKRWLGYLEVAKAAPD